MLNWADLQSAAVCWFLQELSGTSELAVVTALRARAAACLNEKSELKGTLKYSKLC